MIIEILLIYIVYLVIVILSSYYVNLYISKDQFTKDELKEILPYLSKFWTRITGNYSILILGIVIIVSSFLGIIIPMLSNNWFFNSSILFVIMYLTFPLAKRNFDKAKVTTGGDISDTIVNIFAKYYTIILIGFGTGTATALMYNWGAYRIIHFLWFVINFIIKRELNKSID